MQLLHHYRSNQIFIYNLLVHHGVLDARHPNNVHIASEGKAAL